MTVSLEMPKYQSHKKVWALKIAAIEVNEDGSAKITPFDGRFATFTTEPKWADRFAGSKNDDPGYFVVYEGGFKSWSPTEAFEAGYSLIEGN